VYRSQVNLEDGFFANVTRAPEFAGENSSWSRAERRGRAASPSTVETDLFAGQAHG